MQNRFTAGELAALSGISKQTILFYDKKGILTPEFTDPHNGYRYYTAEQLELLDSILMLKEMGLSLQEIRTFLQNRSNEQAMETMKEQKTKIQKKIAYLQLIEKRLSRKIQSLEEFYQDSHQVEICVLEKSDPLAIEPVSNSGTLIAQDIAFKKLLFKAKEKCYPYYYQLGVMVPVAQLRQKQYLKAEYVFLPLGNTREDIPSVMRKSGLYARYFYIGPYLQIGTAYQTLLDYLDTHNYIAGEYAYEYCILDSLTAPTSEEYVTEILIPVTPLSQQALPQS